MESGGYLPRLHSAFLPRNVLAIGAGSFLLRFLLNLNNLCCLQGNPVAITGHLLPVTHNLVDPHRPSDLETRLGLELLFTAYCSFLAVNLGGHVSTVLLCLCHDVTAVGGERHRFVHRFVFLRKNVKLFHPPDFLPLPTLGLCTRNTSWLGLAHTCGRAPCTPPVCTRSATDWRGKPLTLHWGIVSVTQSHFISHFGGGWTVFVPGTATCIHAI